MKRDRIPKFLKALKSQETGYRAGWVLGRCPLAPWTHGGGQDNNPSFGVSFGKKTTICKCLSCGFGGDPTALVFRIKQFQKREPVSGYRLDVAMGIITQTLDELDLDLEDLPEYGEVHHERDEPFPDWWFESFQAALKFPEAMKYLETRGVDLQLTAKLELVYDPLEKRIGFPFRNTKGELMGIQGRAIDDNPNRYHQYGYADRRNMQVWLGEHHLDFDQPIVLVEGPFDYTAVFKEYPNVAASFTSGLSQDKLKRLGDASEIITFYDHGKGGDAARRSIAKAYKNLPITHIIPTPEQDDAGNMTPDEIREVLEEHVKLQPFNSETQ